MAEYIDREALYAAVKKLADEADCNTAILPEVAALIREAPAVDVSSLVLRPGEIADSWEDVMAHVAAGDAAEAYELGNFKPLDLGKEGVIDMEIVGKNVDNLADGTGTAQLSWLGVQCLKNAHRMNRPCDTDFFDKNKLAVGTGSIGGWAKTENFDYLNKTIWQTLPKTLQDAIKQVYKSQDAYDENGNEYIQTCVCRLWIPSEYEMFGDDNRTNEPRYKEIFFDNARRIKKKAGATSASWWWLRSASGTFSFRFVLSDGGDSYYYADDSYGVPLGFCT